MGNVSKKIIWTCAPPQSCFKCPYGDCIKGYGSLKRSKDEKEWLDYTMKIGHAKKGSKEKQPVPPGMYDSVQTAEIAGITINQLYLWRRQGYAESQYINGRHYFSLLTALNLKVRATKTKSWLKSHKEQMKKAGIKG